MAESGGFRSFSSSVPAACITNAANSMKPVPMKLFSTWEVEKSTPSCIPRVCCLTLTRLQVLKPLESELQSILIAIKMQSSKQVLRSNEVVLSPNGLLDTQLDLTFSLQYPHFLKRDGNRLQIMLQRRKKYKNHAMLGYKTLAEGHINMSQVLQKAVDQELCLYSKVKEPSHRVAMVMIMSMSSQPIEHDEHRTARLNDPDRSPGELSEDEDLREYPDFSSNDENSDVEPLPGDEEWTSKFRKLRSVKPALALRQRNLKQKFIALLRRFKVSEEVLESVQDLGDRSDTQYVDDLFDEVENLSDSDIDMDTMSVQSTPKPRLTPFFANRSLSNRSSNVLEVPAKPPPAVDLDKSLEDANSTKQPEADCNMPVSRNQFVALSPLSKSRRFSRHKSASLHERKRSLDLAARRDRMRLLQRRSSADSIEPVQPRRLLMDQLAAVFSSNKTVPECIVLVNTHEWQSQLVAQALQNVGFQTICTCSNVDVRAAVSAIVNKIMKHTSKSLVTPAPMKIAVVGGDSYVSSVLRPYVELFSSKTSEWLGYVRFLVIPFGTSTLAKNLSRLDMRYNALFNDSFWKESVVHKLELQSRFDVAEVASRVVRYLSGANHTVNLMLAEAIITNKDRGTDESSQIIVPFVANVRLGPIDVGNTSSVSCPNDPEEISLSPTVLSGSPPSSSMSSSIIEKVTKESSMNHPVTPVSLTSSGSSSMSVASPVSSNTAMSMTSELTSPGSVDLQVEYWLAGPRLEHNSEKTDRSSRKEVKCSLKTAFRSVQVFRPNNGVQSTGLAEAATLSMIIVTREKKQKIMRLKKQKDLETKKSQQIDGISRLICTSKTQNTVLSVSIDGVDWPAVKFFQLSAQWQTHVKYFPVLLFGVAQAATSVSELASGHPS